MRPLASRSSGPSSSDWSSRSSFQTPAFRSSATTGLRKKRVAASGLPLGRMYQVSDLAASASASRRSASESAASVVSGSTPSRLATTSTAGDWRTFFPASGPISRASMSMPPRLVAIRWIAVRAVLALLKASSAKLASCGL